MQEVHKLNNSEYALLSRRSFSSLYITFSINLSVFWDVISCNVKISGVSTEPVALFFRLSELVIINVKFYIWTPWNREGN